jgi:hypothetical protein
MFMVPCQVAQRQAALMLNEAFSRMKETEYFLDKVPATEQASSWTP